MVLLAPGPTHDSATSPLPFCWNCLSRSFKPPLKTLPPAPPASRPPNPPLSKSSSPPPVSPAPPAPSAAIRADFACPLYPQEQTCAVQPVMSAMGQKRTCGSDQMIIHCNARAGPICGERTGFASPKKITTPCPPHRVESASSGTLKQLSMSCQLFMTQTSPAGLMARSVCICKPPPT
jgi:hypothetical protein